MLTRFTYDTDTAVHTIMYLHEILSQIGTIELKIQSVNSSVQVCVRKLLERWIQDCDKLNFAGSSQDKTTLFYEFDLIYCRSCSCRWVRCYGDELKKIKIQRG